MPATVAPKIAEKGPPNPTDADFFFFLRVGFSSTFSSEDDDFFRRRAGMEGSPPSDSPSDEIEFKAANSSSSSTGLVLFGEPDFDFPGDSVESASDVEERVDADRFVGRLEDLCDRDFDGEVFDGRTGTSSSSFGMSQSSIGSGSELLISKLSLQALQRPFFPIIFHRVCKSCYTPDNKLKS